MDANGRQRRKSEANARGANAQKKKPIEERIRRIEKKLAEAEAKRRTIDDALALPDAYDDAHRETLQQRLVDQAYLTRDIEQLEAEWLEQQSLLEKAA